MISSFSPNQNFLRVLSRSFKDRKMNFKVEILMWIYCQSLKHNFYVKFSVIFLVSHDMNYFIDWNTVV